MDEVTKKQDFKFKIAKRFLAQTALLVLLWGTAYSEDVIPPQPEGNNTGTGKQVQQSTPPLRILPSPYAPQPGLNVPIGEAVPPSGTNAESNPPAVQVFQNEEPKPVPQGLIPAAVTSPVQTSNPVQVNSGTQNILSSDIAPQRTVQKLEPGTVVLNFSEANLKDILRTVAEITGENFIIAPGVSAKITVQTTKPVPKKDIFSIFESILEINGLSAIKSGRYYKIVPSPSAKQRGLDVLKNPKADEVPSGDGMINVIVPVEFISANELMQILKPMLSQAGNIILYAKTNTLILTDTALNIKKAFDLIEALDVNAFERMHIEIVTAKNVNIKTLNRELTDISNLLGFGKDTAQFAAIPLERLNSLILLSSNNQLLASAKEWIGKLDIKTTDEDSSIHMYYVQNDKASNLKNILDQIFGGKKSTQASIPSQAGAPQSNAAPGETDEIKIFIYEPSNSLRRFNSEVQHLGEQEGRCYPKWLCQKENMYTCLCLKET